MHVASAAAVYRLGHDAATTDAEALGDALDGEAVGEVDGVADALVDVDGDPDAVVVCDGVELDELLGVPVQPASSAAARTRRSPRRTLVTRRGYGVRRSAPPNVAGTAQPQPTASRRSRRKRRSASLSVRSMAAS